MNSQLVGVVVGAVIGFGFTALLQSRQFRRNELEGVRERLGLSRGLRADLFAAKLLTEISIKNGEIAAGSLLPVALWEAHGHRLMAALKRESEAAMIDTFPRFAAINGIVGATQRPGGSIPFQDGTLDAPILVNLLEKMVFAIEVLDALESEYEIRELRLRHPIRSRLPKALASPWE